MKISSLFAIVFVGSMLISPTALAQLNITDIAQGGMEAWKTKDIATPTRYNVTDYQNRPAIHARSDNAASGLVLNKRIDLLDTPYMNWSWLVKQSLPELQETTKQGDDFAARVYVVIDGGMRFWNTKSISYVWSSSPISDKVWDNPFAGANVKMLAARGSESISKQWYDEKRNIYQDLIDYFGDKGSDKANQKSYRYIDMVAIMTDTDNSGTHAESYYGDIVFSSR
ncbi:hypothetical protein VIN01S_06140 [Vibrio inusitatus NBRC 102082]|uniref:DUF3047 domain-containing protein n=1 Tax=Vibrio inusitatus NBRC 102082 TaxID=1219070 RepID=A0A4Y3HST4_9VIBR|nr:DUF3047 domain-containing protein [Vibrio inusitatus]GEA49810.1 hypothetical protein VIN01S_06140 [Vibrio inusitatus NBRC 102082]